MPILRGRLQPEGAIVDVQVSWSAGQAPQCLVYVAVTSEQAILGIAMAQQREELLSHAPSAHLEVLVVRDGAVRPARIVISREQGPMRFGPVLFALDRLLIIDDGFVVFVLLLFDETHRVEWFNQIGPKAQGLGRVPKRLLILLIGNQRMIIFSSTPSSLMFFPTLSAKG